MVDRLEDTFEEGKSKVENVQGGELRVIIIICARQDSSPCVLLGTVTYSSPFMHISYFRNPDF